MDVLFCVMQRIGHRARRLIAADASWGMLGAMAAVLPGLWMWGFTVDDALIAVRYARHIAAGFGWRFNLQGPSTDGVTPLPWPVLLAPLAHADSLVVLRRAKTLGLVAWGGAGAALGVAIGRTHGAPRWARALALATMALSVPVAAHSVSGMETALATALATLAAILARRPRSSALVAGVVASLRPEMAAWACTLAIAVAIAARAPVAQALAGVALALAPFAICAVVRETAWGHAAPLAVMAKPSDLAHGFAYAGAAFVVTLAPLLALAPIALRRSPIALAIVLAALAHGMAIVAVGGDWMPYGRLMVPVVPTLAYAGAIVSERANRLATGLRSLCAIALGIWFIARGGTEGRRVGSDRAALVAEARPLLADAHCVAALDIGWVGAATDAEIFDLAGLTDPQVAALPGGHTSKRIDAMFLLSRNPDALLLYTAAGLPENEIEGWRSAQYPRVVEARFVREVVIAKHFAPAAWLRLGNRGAGYVLLRARLNSDL